MAGVNVHAARRSRVTFTVEVELHPDSRSAEMSAILQALCEMAEKGPLKLWREGAVKVEAVAG